MLVLLFATLAVSGATIPLRNKRSTFECAFLPRTKSSSRVSLQFLGVLLLFLVFDLELLFLLSLSFSSHPVFVLFLLFLLGTLLLEAYFLTVR